MKKLKCGGKISLDVEKGVFKLKPSYPVDTRRNEKTGEVYIELVESGLTESLRYMCRKLGFKLVCQDEEIHRGARCR